MTAAPSWPARQAGTDTVRLVDETDPRIYLLAAIEIALVWSRLALDGLIGLGHLITYLEAGGRLDVVTTRAHQELTRTAAALDELPAILDRIDRAITAAETEQ